MIKRFFATKDNTIINAFEENLTTRGTGSNMGASDILEVFSIYGQSDSTSLEKARILIEFDPDFTQVPSSGVSWYLKMFNAPHSQTVPRNFTLAVQAISSSWEEGYGIDMDYYEDKTRDGVGSNWINRTGDNIAEITKFTFTSDDETSYGSSGASNYIKLYNKDTLINVYFSASSGDTSGNTGTWLEVELTGNNSSDYATAFHNVINASSNFSSNVDGSTVYVTASTAASATAHATKVGTLTGLSIEIDTSGSNSTKWISQGGDYLEANAASATFSTGLENLEIDVTDIVNVWKDDSSLNYGFGVMMSGSFEDGTAGRSFFTKKFFGRDSEFFFQRPVLEARWDSARKDDRGYFYASSSLVSANDNLNTLYLYNRVRGRLRDYPVAPTSASIRISADTPIADASASVGRVSTGIYSASIAFETTASTVFDVWYSGSVAYHTGTVSVKSFGSADYNPENAYVLSMPRLRKEYRKNQTHRLDLYVREKNWSPNIYTVAVQSSIPSLIIPSSSYQIRRSIDDLVVVPYGTGSTSHTGLSYDVSGNYFDLDTTYLESGYLYDVQYSFYDEENGWEEQPYRFKFRVVD
jgi:hypothetical protein